MSIFEPLTPCGCGKPGCYFCWLKGKVYTATEPVEIRPADSACGTGLYDILARVSIESDVPIEEIVGQSREERVRIARQMFCYAARLQNKWKDKQIGDAIGRDRTTVIHSHGVVKTMLGMKRPEPEYVVLANRLGIT